MNKFLIIAISFFFFIQTASAYDTTSVRIFFGVNEYKLSEDEKQILNDIIPADSSIILKGIRIYGYCDSAEKDDAKHSLSFKRANEVKKYLISKGLAKLLIAESEGKGKKTAEMNAPSQENRIVLVLIEYEAKIVEQTIIIKSSPKKTID